MRAARLRAAERRAAAVGTPSAAVAAAGEDNNTNECAGVSSLSGGAATGPAAGSADTHSLPTDWPPPPPYTPSASSWETTEAHVPAGWLVTRTSRCCSPPSCSPPHIRRPPHPTHGLVLFPPLDCCRFRVEETSDGCTARVRCIHPARHQCGQPILSISISICRGFEFRFKCSLGRRGSGVPVRHLPGDSIGRGGYALRTPVLLAVSGAVAGGARRRAAGHLPVMQGRCSSGQGCSHLRLGRR